MSRVEEVNETVNRGGEEEMQSIVSSTPALLSGKKPWAVPVFFFSSSFVFLALCGWLVHGAWLKIDSLQENDGRQKLREREKDRERRGERQRKQSKGTKTPQYRSWVSKEEDEESRWEMEMGMRLIIQATKNARKIKDTKRYVKLCTKWQWFEDCWDVMSGFVQLPVTASISAEVQRWLFVIGGVEEAEERREEKWKNVCKENLTAYLNVKPIICGPA